MTTTTTTTTIDIVKSHKIVKATIDKKGNKKYILDNGWIFYVIGSDKFIIETQNKFFYTEKINGEWKYLGKKTKALVEARF